MPTPFVKIVVYVPESDSDRVRQALGDAGAGKVGNYSFSSFSCKGVGRFLPGVGANPHIGQVGVLEAVIEERIETFCRRDLLDTVIAAMKLAHPYEEVAYDVYPLENNFE